MRPAFQAQSKWPMCSANFALVLVALVASMVPADQDAVASSVPASPNGAVHETIGRTCDGTTTSMQQARASGQARLAFHYVPTIGFAYSDNAGHPTGVTIELLRDFAHHVANEYRLDVHVVWLPDANWSDFYARVRDAESGSLGVGNVTITDVRRAELDFSPPYMSNVAVLISHDSIPELTSMDQIATQFEGLTALPFPGTLHEQRLNAIQQRWLPAMTSRPVESNDELIALVADDSNHFGFVDLYNYWRAHNAGAALRRHQVADDVSERFGVILPHSSDWTPVIEAFFRANGGYARSDRFRQHLHDHLGADLATMIFDASTESPTFDPKH